MTIDEVSSQKGNAPGTAFAGSLHDRDGGVESCSQHALADTLGLEVTAVTSDAVYLYVLFLQEDVVAEFQHANGSIEMGPHKVGQTELVASRADKEGTALCQASDRLAGDVVVGNQTAAVGVALKSLVEQAAVELVHVDGYTQQLLVLLEQRHPGVDVAGTVVAVYHGYE